MRETTRHGHAESVDSTHDQDESYTKEALEGQGYGRRAAPHAGDAANANNAAEHC
jgi:hypothetical protein